MAYNTLVRPQVEYASCAWDPHSKHHISKLEMVQRRAARWCCNDFSPYSSVSDMVEKLGWQSLQQRRATSRLIMFYKIVYQLVAVEMPPYYSHPTRTSARHHSLYFRQIVTTKDYYKFSFSPGPLFSGTLSQIVLSLSRTLALSNLPLPRSPSSAPKQQYSF